MMNIKQWAKKWQETGRRLEKIRFENIQKTNTTQAILSFNDAFAHALQHSPPQPTSGLIAQQSVFKKIRNK